MKDEEPEYQATVEELVIGGDAAATTSTVFDGWKMTARWKMEGGRLEPRNVTFDPSDKRALNATNIRALPIGEMLAAARQRIAWAIANLKNTHETRAFDPNPALDLHFRKSLEDAEPRGPQRGQALRPDDLEQVVLVYRSARNRGEPVTDAVRREFHLSRGGAAKRIMRARKMLRERGEEL